MNNAFKVPPRILEHESFTRWVNSLSRDDQNEVHNFMALIAADGIIYDSKPVGRGVHEAVLSQQLKVKFAVVADDLTSKVILLKRTNAELAEALKGCDVYLGELKAITLAEDKRVIFSGDAKSFDVKLDKILNVNFADDGLYFNTGGREKPYAVKLSNRKEMEIVKAILEVAMKKFAA